MEKVSIIVPMFNSEKSVSKLINSLINQTYKNIEIILIDDGSTDQTTKICKNYINDPRIKMYFQEHSGVAAARNQAIQIASGKYMYFCDSDDYLELNMIEQMVNAYQKNHVSLVVSGYYIDVYLKTSLPYVKKISCSEKLYTSKKELKKAFVYFWKIQLLQTVWNKLYISDIIKNNNILFQNLDFGEDIIFNRKYLLQISSLYTISSPLYHYIKKENSSLTEKYINNLFEIRKKEHYEFCNYFDIYGIEKRAYEEYVCTRHINKIFDCVKNFSKCDCPLSFNLKINEIKKIINDPLTKQCLKSFKSENKFSKILVILLKLKSPILLISIFSLANFFKKQIPDLFNLLKKINSTT